MTLPTTPKKVFIIDGDNFFNIRGFYDEVQKVLTDNLIGFGRNLNAFNDILRGGFGRFGYGESIRIIWKHSEKSRAELHEVEGDYILFDLLVDILKDSKNVELSLE